MVNRPKWGNTVARVQRSRDSGLMTGCRWSTGLILLVVLAAGCQTSQTSGPTMTAEQELVRDGAQRVDLSAQSSSDTTSYNLATRSVIYRAPDGSQHFRERGGRTDRGKWTVSEDNLYCFQWRKLGGGQRTCLKIYQLNETVLAVAEGGQVYGRYTVVPGNPENLGLAASQSFSEAYRSYEANIKSGDYTAAVAYAERALELGKFEFGSDHANTAMLQTNLADLYGRTSSSPKEREALYLSAISTLEKEQTSRESVSFAKRSLADVYVRTGETRKARSQFRQALTILEQVKGKDDPEVAGLLIEMGTLEYESGDFDRATRLYRRARSIRETAFGPEDASVADTLFFEAKLNLSYQRYQRAEQLYQRALEIWDGSVPPTHRVRVAALHQLVLLYEKLGRDDLVDEYLLLAAIVDQEEGDVRPLLRVKPRYPSDALQRGREGWVLVEFTISKTGHVTEPKVVDSEGGVFNQAALEAVLQWRYKPKIDHGVAVPREGVQVVLTFAVD